MNIRATGIIYINEEIAKTLGARASRLQTLEKCELEARVPGKAGGFAITSNGAVKISV